MEAGMDIMYGNRQQLASIAENAQDILVTATAVFPFDFFPDSISVDRTKVTIHKRLFFGQTEVKSLQVEDILNVEIDAGPLFASLKITSRVPNQPPMEVHYLPKHQAAEIHSIIEGYNIARAKKIDCSTIPKKDLVPLLVRLGHEANQ
jgi:hypothetical protein